VILFMHAITASEGGVQPLEVAGKPLQRGVRDLSHDSQRMVSRNTLRR
jgi:hypothetical protein